MQIGHEMGQRDRVVGGVGRAGGIGRAVLTSSDLCETGRAFCLRCFRCLLRNISAFLGGMCQGLFSGLQKIGAKAVVLDKSWPQNGGRPTHR